MDNNWMKKVWNKLFDVDEEETIEKRKEDAPVRKRAQDHNPIDRKHSIGRMENANRKSEARVVHQYPREGNFRFPLIPDQSNNRTRKDLKTEKQERNENEKPAPSWSEQHQSKKQGPSKNNPRNTPRNTKSAEPETEKSKKFTGVNFKPSDIPSPIYGFSKRPVVEKMEEAAKSAPSNHYTSLDENKTMEKLIRDTETYTPKEEVDQSISGEASTFEKKVSQLDDSQAEATNDQHETQIDSSVIEEVGNVAAEHADGNVGEEPIQHEECEPVEEVYEPAMAVPQPEDADVEEDVTLEEDIDVEEHVALEENTNVEEHKALEEDTNVEEHKALEEDSELENQVALEEDSVQYESQYVDRSENHESSEVIHAESNESETAELAQISNVETATTLEDKQEDQNGEEEIQEQQPQSKREEGRPKPQVPYNVMMLANDRRHLSKKPVSGAEYKLPPISLLDIPPRNEGTDDQWLQEQRELLESTLENFNVQARVVGATMGPTVTRFEVQPSPGVKVNKITNLSDDIKLSLAARDIRMEAPIPGKNAIGIEVPNPTSKPVFIREIVRSGAFQSEGSLLNAALGFDIAGEAKITDIQKMPHGLIAGATGSGKSVCINSILVSLLLKANPSDVKMLLIDPKMVELAPYNGLPHLVTPVINDVKEATTALKWAVDEMEERYEKFAAAGVRDIKRYNERAINHGEPQHKLPYIVIVIDELADLMMVSPQDVEDAICRIAQKARACGIHLLVATQRPSVDVITGLIKANIPTRIAFSVSSQIDSRTILDASGAEKLLGKGDMLCLENGSSKPVRLQGNFVSDEEIERVTSFVRKQRKPNYLIKKEDLMKKQQYNDQEDDLFEEACMWAFEQGQASSSALQRRFRIGFNRAARLIEMMEERGLVSEAMGSKPRSILMNKTDFEDAFFKDMHV
ncbi:DNA translocase FtsK [Alkalihalobacillus macyae]|uniref:DNA translocase FtsK n=1 Tax=Guptibacillus hwajinpoensis TaxID=208199 RepID=UPI00273A9FB3|nr:DNA translocase FtsK [Alkalihalobacillus macyae]MDP4550965.1 DNA translocase FtsK [Alkalihalobacillus macyae]